MQSPCKDISLLGKPSLSCFSPGQPGLGMSRTARRAHSSGEESVRLGRWGSKIGQETGLQQEGGMVGKGRWWLPSRACWEKKEHHWEKAAWPLRKS